jgi:hypothetical protein
LKILEADRTDLEHEGKEMAGKMNKDRKETKKETARLKESYEKREESLVKERKVRRVGIGKYRK